LRQAGRTEAEAGALLEALVRDYRTVPLTSADRAMLDYVAKLTHGPSSITAGDADALRAAGFDDRAIHDVCAITAYYAFVNRIADGLGVELEDRLRSAGAAPGDPGG
jgi:uncharacterized peroxidase-related enzyme